jgi:hypothetical protein
MYPEILIIEISFLDDFDFSNSTTVSIVIGVSMFFIVVSAHSAMIYSGE